MSAAMGWFACSGIWVATALAYGRDRKPGAAIASALVSARSAVIAVILMMS